MSGDHDDGSTGPSRHRLNDLLGMTVCFADGSRGDCVTDVRLVPGDSIRGHLAELVTEGLVVGKRRPGTLFGYDRHPDQGPWMIRVIVRWMHRHTGYLQWSDVEQIDWEDREVHVTVTGLRDLQASRPGGPRRDH
jgi:hypothetical protein